MASIVLATVLVLGAEISTTALVVATVAALAVDYKLNSMDSGGGDSGQMTTAPTGTSIDKSSLQQEAKVGDLELGEEAKKKLNRKKGKAAFKVELSPEEKAAQDAASEAGVQAPEVKQTGVQL